MKTLDSINPKILRNIRLLICDVDGVLTDGKLIYGPEGELLKHFNAKDGLGIRLLISQGIDVAIITARDSKPLRCRIKDLGITHFYPGQEDKLLALKDLSSSLKLEFQQVAYIGDDILDLPAMRQVGISIAVADAHSSVKIEADAVTHLNCGGGAVREVADVLINSHRPLIEAYERFLEREVEADCLTTA